MRPDTDLRAHGYGLLRTIMGTAASDGKIPGNPCVIRGAGSRQRVHKIPARQPRRSLEKIADEMPEQYQAMVLLASWCALRFGELTELRRARRRPGRGSDPGRAAPSSAPTGRIQVTTPKSDAGIRDVSIPPHLLPALAATGRDTLARLAIRCCSRAQRRSLGPGDPLPAFLQSPREGEASRPAMARFTPSACVLAAATGASSAELMGGWDIRHPQRRCDINTEPKAATAKSPLYCRRSPRTGARDGQAIEYVVICACTGREIEPVAYIDDHRRTGGSVCFGAADPEKKQIISATGYHPELENWRAPDGYIAGTWAQRNVSETIWNREGAFARPAGLFVAATAASRRRCRKRP